MVVNHLLDRDVSVVLDTDNKSHLPGQPHRMLAKAIAGERVQVKRTDTVEVLDALGLEQRGDALDISASDVGSPCPDGIRSSLVPLLQAAIAKLDVHVSPHN